MEQVVKSFNLWVDSEFGDLTGSTGDNYRVDLGSSPVSCGSGEYIRLSLVNFFMFNNTPTINNTNNKFTMTVKMGANFNPTTLPNPNSNYDATNKVYTIVGELPLVHHTNLLSLATSFANVLNDIMNTNFNYTDPTSGTILNWVNNVIEPPATTTYGGNTDHKIRINIISPNIGPVFTTATQATDLFIDSVSINTNSELGQMLGITSSTNLHYLPLGGSNFFGASLIFEAGNAAQVSYNTHVYLRTDVTSTGLETKSFSSAGSMVGKEGVSPSDILGRFLSVGSPLIHYECNTGTEYFVHCKNSVLSSIRFRLTDNRNRGIDEITGNKLTFSLCVRVEVVRNNHPKLLQTEPYVPPVPARFNNILSKQDFGRDGYGKPPGF